MNSKKTTYLALVAAAAFLFGAATHGQVPPIRGTITASGYNPPAGLTVLWKCSDGRSMTKRLNPAAPWNAFGDGAAHMARYAEGENMPAQGCYLPQARGEWVGGRQWPIANRLFELAGISRKPRPSEVYDILLANFDTTPNCCDWVRLFKEPDPIAGNMCTCGRTGTGTPLPSNAKNPAPFDLKLDGRRLIFKWNGEGQVNFTVYEPPAVEGAGFYLLGTAKVPSIVLDRRPADGTTILLQARQKGKEPSDVPFRVGESKPVEPIDPTPQPPPPLPPPPPATCKLTDVLPSTTLDALWTALSSAQREQLIIRVLETLLKERNNLP